MVRVPEKRKCFSTELRGSTAPKAARHPLGMVKMDRNAWLKRRQQTLCLTQWWEEVYLVHPSTTSNAPAS